MAVFTSDLKEVVMKYARQSDSVIIISGFFSPGILGEIAEIGIPVTFYYGMYLKNGISPTSYASLKLLEKKYKNLKIYVPIQYHVHTKCYIFNKNGVTQNILVGSANCSSSALCSAQHSELLIPVVDAGDMDFFNRYVTELEKTSVSFDDPVITPDEKDKILSPEFRGRGLPESWNKYTGNPFSAIIPLYTVKNNLPVVQSTDGLNWGNGPHASRQPEMESILPIRKFHIEHYPALIPFNGPVGSGFGGKIQRMQTPINMIWDDGTEMEMLFQQRGVEIPSKSHRSSGDPFKQYPKALTASSGGRELGEYLRKRMGLPPNAIITYQDLRNYKRDYVTLTLTNEENYELDFGVE